MGELLTSKGSEDISKYGDVKVVLLMWSTELHTNAQIKPWFHIFPPFYILDNTHAVKTVVNAYQRHGDRRLQFH